MKNVNKKELFIKLIPLFITLLSCIILVSYAYYKIKLEGQKTHFVSTDVISFTYKESEDKISITNMEPKSDAEGIKENYFEFNVASNLVKDISINYEISILKTSTTNSFEENDVKAYLTDGNDNALVNPILISNLGNSKKIANAKVIYNNSFMYNNSNEIQTHTYRLRVWLKSDINMSKYTKVVETETGTNVSLEQKTYKFKINVNTIESVDTSGANKPILASNMIPVYYFRSTIKKADVNNFYSVETYKLGDLNGDGKINVADVGKISGYLSNYDGFTQLEKLAADVDGDGAITDNDEKIIYAKFLKNIQTFPAGEPLEERKGITSNKWYSYESSGENKGMWANAVTVTSDKLETYKNASVGTTISMDDITTMWVWIPRFNASLPSNYNRGTKDNPGAIDVSFVKQNEPAIDAFTFGNKELSGFWYGKFEIGGTLASSCTNETCNVSNIVVKPNVTSLRDYKKPNDFYFLARSMEQAGNSFGFVSAEVDTHMSKNNEWGAVAYLTHSIYGRCTTSTTCTEIGINNNSSFITGYGSPAKTTLDKNNGTYDTDLGKDASTTKNIYGIYDMSGGAAEFVMGVYNKTISGSGFNNLPDSKYYNNYTTTSYQGHALAETAGWYDNYNIVPSTSYPWFVRGGNYGNSGSGIFSFYDYGPGTTAQPQYSSRFVITNE